MLHSFSCSFIPLIILQKFDECRMDMIITQKKKYNKISITIIHVTHTHPITLYLFEVSNIEAPNLWIIIFFCVFFMNSEFLFIYFFSWLLLIYIVYSTNYIFILIYTYVQTHTHRHTYDIVHHTIMFDCS